eukprot:TRINITY_DN428_c2_g1_i1.p1 TRINITY_DN428_c2_g1~~TRINITY_DN428_c2_g1_i1.p1  ORF type:complete len:181 (+),score=97.97 TRINITY_DN428_c2_g1_i1:80-544(+)
MIHFLFLISRQGKVRLVKWYNSPPGGNKEKTRLIRDVTSMVLSRPQKMANVLEWKDKLLVYKRYASLYFIAGVSRTDNILITLEALHLYVEILDRYFGNVCELDLIFNFHKAYYVLDELVIAGELQEPSKKCVLRMTAAQDAMMEDPNNSRLDG